MKPFQLLAKTLVRSFLQYDNERLEARMEYHYMMARACEERIVANRIRLEDMETR